MKEQFEDTETSYLRLRALHQNLIEVSKYLVQRTRSLAFAQIYVHIGSMPHARLVNVCWCRESSAPVPCVCIPQQTFWGIDYCWTSE